MLSTLEKLNAGNCQSQDLNSNLLTPPETLFSLYFYPDQTYQIAQSFILNYHGPPDLPCMEHIWLGIYVQERKCVLKPAQYTPSMLSASQAISLQRQWDQRGSGLSILLTSGELGLLCKPKPSHPYACAQPHPSAYLPFLQLSLFFQPQFTGHIFLEAFFSKPAWITISF